MKILQGTEKFNMMSKVFMDAADPIIIEDLDGIVIEMNDEAVRSYGWSREELLGKPIKTIIPPKRHQEAEDLLVNCRAGKITRNIDGLRRNKKGVIIPVLITLSLLVDDEKKPIGISTLAKDISTQKEVEKNLRRMSKVFMDAADPIIIEDLDGKVIEMNDEAERSYGWSRDELLGQHINTIVPPDRHHQAQELLERCKMGGEVRNVEGLRWIRDGKTIPVLLTLSLLKNEDGKPIGISTLAKDITNQKNAELKLSEGIKKIETLSKDLAKYLPLQVYESIFSGERTVKITTERKKLTIFFSDIKNFTITTEHMEPEDLTALLNDYLSEMGKIALNYGGTIDKYIGDSIMIFFGDPQSKGVKEDALACARMAISMQCRMVDFRAKWKDIGFKNPFQMRIGINTGYCNVGNFGSDLHMDYTIIGSEVNLASRLESICEEDSILMAEETYELVKDEIDSEPIKPIFLKGITREIIPYRPKNIYNYNDPNLSYIRSKNEFMHLFIDLKNLSEEDRVKTAEELESHAEKLRSVK